MKEILFSPKIGIHPLIRFRRISKQMYHYYTTVSPPCKHPLSGLLAVAAVSVRVCSEGSGVGLHEMAVARLYFCALALSSVVAVVRQTAAVGMN